jgi:hypothetical protein
MKEKQQSYGLQTYGAGLLNVLADALQGELADQVLELAVGLAGDDLRHLLADGADLGGLRVRGLADLVLALVGEGHAEHTKDEAIGGLHVNVALDQSLPLLDEAAELVRGEVHACKQFVSACHVGAGSGKTNSTFDTKAHTHFGPNRTSLSLKPLSH